MFRSLEVGYWLTLILAVPTAGFLVRIFIIQHDCGHGSFFGSRRANDLLGAVCGVLTLTPYYFWRRSHAIHHASSGNLEERGVGDVPTLTVREYLARSRWGRLKYRVLRHPLVLFGIAPTWQLVVMHRFVYHAFDPGQRERRSVWFTNLALAAAAISLGLIMGFDRFLLVHAPVIFLTASAGMWLFFVQHQFEDAYWSTPPDWDYAGAALRGSSYYRLPRLLQWFSGNIGFHHIHHLSPRIPNYRLQACHDENPIFQRVVVLTLASSLRTAALSLWDEDKKKLVSFRQLTPPPEIG